MFSVDTKEENGFDIIVLKDESAGTRVEIIPACGAIMHAFEIKYADMAINIIEQYSSKKEFDEEVESRGFRSCKLSPFAGRLKEGKFEFGEQEYAIEKFYLGKHALHGLLYDASFDVIKIDADNEKASAELLFSYRATDKGFPFKYDCRIIYELQKENSVQVTSVIKNRESVAIPMTDGWHPYFNLGGQIDQLELSLQANETLEFDEELIPTGKITAYNNNFRQLTKIGDTTFDNGFIVDFKKDEPAVILKNPEKKLQLEIHPDHSYPYLQLYTPDDRQSIALENLSAAPDAFNNRLGLTTIPAGNEAIYRTKFRIVHTA